MQGREAGYTVEKPSAHVSGEIDGLEERNCTPEEAADAVAEAAVTIEERTEWIEEVAEVFEFSIYMVEKRPETLEERTYTLEKWIVALEKSAVAFEQATYAPKMRSGDRTVARSAGGSASVSGKDRVMRRLTWTLRRRYRRR